MNNKPSLLSRRRVILSLIFLVVSWYGGSYRRGDDDGVHRQHLRVLRDKGLGSAGIFFDGGHESLLSVRNTA